MRLLQSYKPQGEPMSPNNDSDFLVLGSGVAGLFYALRVAEHGRVTVVTKKEAVQSATNFAQGGIAAVVSNEDSFDSHTEDTMTAGAGLCHEDVVTHVVENGIFRRGLSDLMSAAQLGVARSSNGRRRMKSAPPRTRWSPSSRAASAQSSPA